jgi:benzoyl-CoA reductase subunit BamC
MHPPNVLGRDKYTIDGKEYDECAFCRASCPSRDFFKEPDSGLPLKCDMCESDPPHRRALVRSVVHSMMP